MRTPLIAIPDATTKVVFSMTMGLFRLLLLVHPSSVLELSIFRFLYISPAYTPFDTHNTMGWKNVNVIIEDKLLLGKFVSYPLPLSIRILQCI